MQHPRSAVWCRFVAVGSHSDEVARASVTGQSELVNTIRSTRLRWLGRCLAYFQSINQWFNVNQSVTFYRGLSNEDYLQVHRSANNGKIAGTKTYSVDVPMSQCMMQ